MILKKDDVSLVEEGVDEQMIDVSECPLW